MFRGAEHEQWKDEIPACAAGFNTGQFATQTCFQVNYVFLVHIAVVLQTFSGIFFILTFSIARKR